MKSRYKGQYGKVFCPECESEMHYDRTGGWICENCNWLIEDDELEDYAIFEDLRYDAIWVPDVEEWNVEDLG